MRAYEYNLSPIVSSKPCTDPCIHKCGRTYPHSIMFT